jgi:hypothetical protein
VSWKSKITPDDIKRSEDLRLKLSETNARRAERPLKRLAEARGLRLVRAHEPEAADHYIDARKIDRYKLVNSRNRTVWGKGPLATLEQIEKFLNQRNL